VALAAASVLAAAVVVWKVPGAPPRSTRERSEAVRVPLGSAAWTSLFVSAATAASGIGIFVVSGVGLDERHGVSTAGLGAIAAGFGVVELGSSSAVAAVGDRIGTRRSIVIGLVVLLVGLGVMVGSGDVRAMAVAGLVIFLAGFEFAFVSSIALVTEAAPDARGRAIGIGNAVGTLARSAAVAAGGLAYEAFGIVGSVTLSAAAAALALGLILARGGP
jgi:predicted MFS family arabinose efflux permease